MVSPGGECRRLPNHGTQTRLAATLHRQCYTWNSHETRTSPVSSTSVSTARQPSSMRGRGRVHTWYRPTRNYIF